MEKPCAKSISLDCLVLDFKGVQIHNVDVK